MNATNLTELYQYFDDLAASDADSDTLFASSYIRGFLALVASNYGDESQKISQALIESVTAELNKARAELTPQDNAVVTNYWVTLQNDFQW